MAFLKHLPKVLFAALFVWISFIPLPLQYRYIVQLRIFFLTGFVLLLVKDRKSIFRDSDWPLWLFLAVLSFSVYNASFPDMATKTYLDLSIPLIFIYYLVATDAFSEENFVFLSRLICIFSLLVAFWGLLDVVLRVDVLYESFLRNPFYNDFKYEWPMRAVATQYHAPPLGTYLIASLPFSVLTMKQDRPLYKVLGIISFVLTVDAAILTLSRGVFLSLFCMCFFVFCFQKKTRRIFFLFLGVVVFIIAAGQFQGPLAKYGIQRFFITSDGIFTSYRFRRFQMLGSILRGHPFLGIGFQHVRLLFFRYYSGKRAVSYDFRIMDNMYFTLAAETGLVGFASFLIFLVSVIVKGWRRFQGCRDDLVAQTRLFYMGIGFIGLLVNAAAYELFYWPSQYMFFCIYVGLMEAFYRRSIAPQRGMIGGK